MAATIHSIFTLRVLETNEAPIINKTNELTSIKALNFIPDKASIRKLLIALRILFVSAMKFFLSARFSILFFNKF